MGGYAFVFFNISDALSDFFIFTVVAEITFKQGRRFNILSLMILSVAVAVILGTHLGMRINSNLQENHILFSGAFAILFCGTLLILPWLLKLISVDMLRIWKINLFFSARQTGTKEMFLFDNRLIQAAESGDSLKWFNETLAAEKRLTVRELEIAGMLLRRYDYNTIAQQLYISVNTLKVHIKHIYQKYNVSGKKELIELIELWHRQEK